MAREQRRWVSYLGYVADVIEPVPGGVLDSDSYAAGLCESIGLEQHVDIAVSIEVEVERVAYGAVRVENFPKPCDDVGRPEAEVLLFGVGARACVTMTGTSEFGNPEATQSAELDCNGASRAARRTNRGELRTLRECRFDNLKTTPQPCSQLPAST